MPTARITPSLTPASDLLQRKRRALVRLGLAWLAMMQVMMFALPGYLRPEAGGQDSLEVLEWAIFLMNWASLTLTIPVMLYSAWPIWRGCLQAASRHRVTMDVPVAISMVAAFAPSVIATFKGAGEVYFDSVTMFVAFLLTARFIEERARDSAPSLADGFSRTLLQQADRVATLFVLVQLTFALVIAYAWWLLAPAHAWPVLVSLLVMSCPCALSLAAPVSLAAMRMRLAVGEPLSATAQQALSERATTITRQNLYGSLLWHIFTMPFAALGWVTPWLAALAMLLSSAAVVVNAWRLYRGARVPLKQAAQALARQAHLSV